MTDPARPVDDSGSGFELIELSVVFATTSNNPSIINPDFLARAGIVGEDSPLSGDPITTPVFSLVKYQTGLAVQADPERVVLTESPNTGNRVGARCARMASTYAQAVPHVAYRGIGVNPKFFFHLVPTVQAEMARLLHERGGWLEFKDCEPTVQLKAVYALDARQITVDASAATRRLGQGAEQRGLLVQCNVHRELTGDAEERADAMATILERWERDMKDCREVARRFAGRLQQEAQ